MTALCAEARKYPFSINKHHNLGRLDFSFPSVMYRLSKIPSSPSWNFVRWYVELSVVELCEEKCRCFLLKEKCAGGSQEVSI